MPRSRQYEDDEEDPTKRWGKVWKPEDDEEDDEEGRAKAQKGKGREVGKFYSINPPQTTASRLLENFDPKTFLDRGTPKLQEDSLAEQITFARAIFFGNVADEEWIHEILTSKMASIKDELEIFIGQEMGRPDGPWRLFLSRRTTCGSIVEEE